MWIGQYAIINASCKKIGNGAVIGAGAIVTKDVPAYAVVVGSPARIIKYRFSEDIIAKLEESQWWNYDLDEIRSNVESFQSVEAILQFIDTKG